MILGHDLGHDYVRPLGQKPILCGFPDAVFSGIMTRKSP